MARLYDYGAESGGIEDWVVSHAAVSGVQKHTGSYALRLYRSYIYGISGSAYHNFDSAAEVYAQFAVYINTLTGPGNDVRFRFRLYDKDDGSNPVEVTFRENDKNNIRYEWGSLADATAAFVWANATWYVVEVHAKIQAGGDETLQITIDGTTVLDWTGEAAPGWTEFDRLHFYAYTTDEAGPPTTSVFDVYIDDVFVNSAAGAESNSWVGQLRLWPLPVTGAGVYTQLARGGVDSGANWSQVDEIPYDTTEWVREAIARKKDSYEVTDTPATIAGTVYDIRAVILRGRARVTIGGLNAGLRAFVLSGGSIPDYCPCPDWTPSVQWDTYRCRYPDNPADDQDWERADVDAIEAGVKVIIS